MEEKLTWVSSTSKSVQLTEVKEDVTILKHMQIAQGTSYYP